MDCYLAQVLSVKQTHQWIATIDVIDGRCFSGKTWNHNQKEQAEKELEEMKKKLDVNLVKDDRKRSLALTKEERYNKWLIEYKDKEMR